VIRRTILIFELAAQERIPGDADAENNEHTAHSTVRMPKRRHGNILVPADVEICVVFTKEIAI
jgi:hypothetical protein